MITNGIYAHIRHPIYASMWLWTIAQALLLHNWIAGLSGLLTYIPVYFTRVQREEQLLLDRFGSEYREYMEETGRIIPKS